MFSGFLLNIRCFTHPQDTVYVIRCFSTDYNVVATTEMRMVQWAMGVSPLEHWRNEEILGEARVEGDSHDKAKVGMVWARQK